MFATYLAARHELDMAGQMEEDIIPAGTAASDELSQVNGQEVLLSESIAMSQSSEDHCLDTIDIKHEAVNFGDIKQEAESSFHEIEIKQEPTTNETPSPKKRKRKKGENDPNHKPIERKKKKAPVAPLETNPDELMKEPKLEPSEQEDENDSFSKRGFLCTEDIDFPLKDLPMLLDRIKAAIPVNDSLVFKTRSKKLDFRNICFGEYSPEKCQEAWLKIQKYQRPYRLLTEVTMDAREWCKRPQDFYKGNKMRQHPDFPRRPMTAYMLFFNERKYKLLTEHPTLKVSDLTRIIQQEHAEMSDEARSIYLRLADQSKARYEQEIEEFYVRHPEFVRKAVPADKPPPVEKRIMKKLPRKPHTPFNLFMEEQMKLRNIHEKSGFKETCKKEWKNLSDNKKLTWIDLALELERQYHEKVVEMQTENPDFVPPPTLKNLLSREDKHVKERLSGKPQKPPNSAYGLYSKILLQSGELKKFESKDRMKVIATKWKELTQEQRDAYIEQAKNLLEEYKVAYANYLKTLPQDKREQEVAKSSKKKREEAAVTAAAQQNYKKTETESKPLPTNLYDAVYPLMWDNMDDEERLMYRKYITKIRDYFDSNHLNASEQLAKASSSSETQSDSDTDD